MPTGDIEPSTIARGIGVGFDTLISQILVCSCLEGLALAYIFIIQLNFQWYSLPWTEEGIDLFSAVELHYTNL